MTLTTEYAYASRGKEAIEGVSYDLPEDSKYKIESGVVTEEKAERFIISGDFESGKLNNGIHSYEVKSGVLEINIDTSFADELLHPSKDTDWHIVKDKAEKVDATDFGDDIEKGAIIIQTSKDG